MPEAARLAIDDYLTAQWSDDMDAPKRAEARLQGYIMSYGKDQIDEWISERARVIYGTHNDDSQGIDQLPADDRGQGATSDLADVSGKTLPDPTEQA